MKCQVKWVDKNGKLTPDENDAVAIGHFHKIKSIIPDTEYLPEIASSYGVCAEHMAQVRYNWKYGSGGGWTFEDIKEN